MQLQKIKCEENVELVCRTGVHIALETPHNLTDIKIVIDADNIVT